MRNLRRGRSLGSLALQALLLPALGLLFSPSTGRAEGDEHAHAVNYTQTIISLDEASQKSRGQVIARVVAALERIALMHVGEQVVVVGHGAQRRVRT